MAVDEDEDAERGIEVDVTDPCDDDNDVVLLDDDGSIDILYFRYHHRKMNNSEHRIYEL